jgi:hypothetical protein
MTIGGTDQYEKMLVGSGITILSVGVLVYSAGLAEGPFLVTPGGQPVPNPNPEVPHPESSTIPGPVGWVVYGLSLVFSGFAQIGCEEAGNCSP